jgi:hypothetical protein
VAGIALPLKHAELTSWEGLKNMLAPIQMPEVEMAGGGATDAARPKAPQGSPMVSELIYKVNLKSSVFFAYQGFQAPEAVLSGFPESLALREFQRLNKSALSCSADRPCFEGLS